MALEVIDFEFEEGQTNMGGTAGKVYYAPASHIESIPVPGADGITITGPIVMKDGKRFGSIYMTRDTGMVEDKEVGEMDGGSFETELEWFTPKINAQLLKLKSIFSNGGFIFIIKDGNGTQRLVGSLDHPAFRVPGSVAGGKTPKDRNGASFKFSAASAKPAFIYTGAIPLEPAVVEGP